MKFKDKFNRFACVGDRITTEVDGFTITARIEHDECSHIDDCDTWSTDQSVTGCNNEEFAKLMAARADWFNDEWVFCGIVLSVERNGIMLDRMAASLWSIECNYPGSDNSYLTEVANDLLPEALEAGKSIMAKLLEGFEVAA